MSNFLDANVWLALIWRRHEHSERAREWLDRAGEGPFLFCRFTQLTVLRLLTTASVMGGDVQTMKRAWEIWDDIIADSRMAFMPEPVLHQHERLHIHAERLLEAESHVAGKIGLGVQKTG